MLWHHFVLLPIYNTNNRKEGRIREDTSPLCFQSFSISMLIDDL